MSVRKYRVTVRGTETIMRLNDRDLEQYPDAQPVDDKTPTGPTTGEPTRASGKTRAAGNKARDAAADKASG